MNLQDTESNDSRLTNGCDLKEPNKTDELETKSKSVLNVTKARSCKRGIVYLGYVPEGLTVKNIRQILSKYGEVERIFLERANSEAKNSKRYTEGWIEFKKKSVAKLVANLLNGSQIKGKRRTKFYDSLWNMKYLKRFKWSHLAEQIAYEKALREQRLRLEIGRAKREATFYTEMIERKRHKRAIYNDTTRSYKQRLTDEQIRLEKQSNDELDDELLESIFK